jgi:hypothetical protein
MSTPVPPVGPRRGGPPAVPPIRVLTPARAHAEGGSDEARERERRRRELARRRADPDPPAEGVDVRA